MSDHHHSHESVPSDGVFVLFERVGGGTVFIARSDIVIGSTANYSIEEGKPSESHEDQTGVYVARLGLNVLVQHTVEEVMEMIRKAT